MKFNENLKYLRKQANLTQEQLAEKLNVSRQAVTKWESGEGLPDIENLKEIAYIFSVSTDALIGDVECKGENKLKKKINDLGWFVFAWAIIFVSYIIMPISNVIDETYKDSDITNMSMIGMFFISFIIFGLIIKLYFKKENKILDMTPTEKGRKIRRRELTKKLLIIFLFSQILSIISNLSVISEGWATFARYLIESLLAESILIVLFGIYLYKKQEKEVKKLNETK